MQDFWSALDARLAPYNLLSHTYYQAWSHGELSRENLRDYAAEYWHHVSAFPAYLSALHARLPDGALRRTVLANLMDEEGLPKGRPHSDLWMDFATGMGADADAVRARETNHETAALVAHFQQAMQGKPAAALTALYAYESRVPEIAATKEEGLEAHYETDAASRRYFAVHKTADIKHARVWREAIEAELAAHPEDREAALDAGEAAARALWLALDGVEAQRQAGLERAA